MNEPMNGNLFVTMRRQLTSPFPICTDRLLNRYKSQNTLTVRRVRLREGCGQPASGDDDDVNVIMRAPHLRSTGVDGQNSNLIVAATFERIAQMRPCPFSCPEATN
uniref:Uncharacterized protein n=1 Tax=Steinernema glaseri TaxID=37863 RepID=A0A1I7Z649_9BILA